MKNTIKILALLAISYSGFAQDESSSEYKPSKGSVTTEVGLTGGLGNSGFNLNTGASVVGNPMLKFRYFYKNDIAFRLGFSANRTATDSKPTTTTTTSPVATPVPAFTPSSESIANSTFFAINLGVEKHFKGSDRLSTFAGADLLFANESSYSESTNNTAANSSTVIVDKNNNGGGYLGLSLLTGADYYIAKKVYLGVELGLAFLRFKDKDRILTTTNTVAGAVSTTEITTANDGSTFNLQTRLLSGVRIGYQF